MKDLIGVKITRRQREIYTDKQQKQVPQLPHSFQCYHRAGYGLDCIIILDLVQIVTTPFRVILNRDSGFVSAFPLQIATTRQLGETLGGLY